MGSIIVNEIVSSKIGRIKTIISRIKDEPVDHCFDSKINRINRNAVSWFLNNQRNMLCVSSDSSVKDCYTSFERYEKLLRINAAQNFDSDFKIACLSSPRRDLGSCQKSLIECKSVESTFFSFTSNNSLLCWISQEYRNEFVSDGFEYAVFDLFLSEYLYRIVFDPEIEQTLRWENIFRYIEYICIDNIKPIRGRISADDFGELSNNELLSAFMRTILRPVEDLTKELDMSSLLTIYKLVNNLNKSVYYEFKVKLTDRIKVLFEAHFRQASLLFDAYSKSPNQENEASAIHEYNNLYDMMVKILNCFNNGTNKSITGKIIGKSFKNNVWDYMLACYQNQRLDSAKIIANHIFEYCDLEEKKILSELFGL